MQCTAYAETRLVCNEVVEILIRRTGNDTRYTLRVRALRQKKRQKQPITKPIKDSKDV